MNETKPISAARSPRKRAAKPAEGPAARPVRERAAKDALRHGFYTSLFTPEEIRHLDAGSTGIRDEMNLLRTKILRLARLTPLKRIDAKELETLIKLIRVVAVLDALERTGVMARKVDASASPLLEALADMDPEDL
jgi:hypothetical protein